MYAFQTSTVSAIIVGFLLMMCLYVLMASVVAVYAPELFATKVRFRCVGFANAVAKLLNVLMPMVVGWMLTYLAWCHVHLCGHQRNCYCIDADCRLLWRGDCAEVGWVIGFLTVE